ncbi:MAG: NAD(+) synthase [Lachnospiraceae bacterium]|nr:NAD(+) synthase [Lachnospiraceae bacterium]
MKDGFIKTAALTPRITVADTVANGERIRALMKEASRNNVKIAVFPELCITGYTCGDLFYQKRLLVSAKEELWRIAAYSGQLDGIFFVGLPFEADGKLYNMAAAVSGGRVLGMVPKTSLPNYHEFYEARQFTSGAGLDRYWCEEIPESVLSEFSQSDSDRSSRKNSENNTKKVHCADESLAVFREKTDGGGTSGTTAAGKKAETEQSFRISDRLLFTSDAVPGLTIGVEICEDLWTPNPPSIRHALHGANVIVNLSASDEVTGKSRYRRDLVAGQSARLVCGYIYASAGDGESTQDVVYSGHNLIAENGQVLAEAEPFSRAGAIGNNGFDTIGRAYNIENGNNIESTDREARIEDKNRADKDRTVRDEFKAGYRCTDSPDAENNAVKVSERNHTILNSNGSGICSEFDIDRLVAERRRMTTFPAVKETESDGYGVIRFHLNQEETVLTRYIDPAPFVPGKQGDRDYRCNEILTIQAMGLKKRIEHTNCKHPVVGISGGLDSTLALLVMARAFDLLGRDRKDLVAVTMPGFGTTDRTYENACRMVRSLGATLMEIPIADAVNRHFQDIGQDPSVHDVTYENSQARERTQILMDVANRLGGMVVGTGDLSELALGWATYNGDHMSMYAVNCSVPKTLVRHLVRYYADTCGDEALADVLYDVLDTPVSPELLPPEDGQISQKTEDLVGPYELHDFFLYYVLRFGFSPAKVYRLAVRAFADNGTYEKEVILKWLKTFYRRFFAQQFKRSCLPDGPKVGSVAVSPRGDLRMPSDASARIWLEELEEIE